MQTPDKLHGTPSVHTLCTFLCVALTLVSVTYTMHLHFELSRAKQRLATMESKQAQAELLGSVFSPAMTVRAESKPASSDASALEEELQAMQDSLTEPAPAETKQPANIVKTPAPDSTPVAAATQEPLVAATTPTKEAKPEPVAVSTPVKEVSKPVETARVKTPAVVEDKVKTPDVAEAPARDTLDDTESSLAAAMAHGTTVSPPPVVSQPPKASGETVVADSASASDSSIAEVLASNPEQQRVIISRGYASGLEKGARFSVYRNRDYVGDIRVVKTFSDMSTCDIVTPTPKGIRMGDLVRKAH